MRSKPETDDVRGNLWARADEEWLRQNYENVSGAAAARYLNRSERAVRAKAFNMFGKGALKRKSELAKKRRAATEALAYCEALGEAKSACVGGRRGWIYLMRGRGTSIYKIGFTECDVYRRLNSMNSQSAIPVDLVAARAGTLWQEAVYHLRFRKECSHGEWFNLSDDVAADLVKEFQDCGRVSRETLRLAPPSPT